MKKPHSNVIDFKEAKEKREPLYFTCRCRRYKDEEGIELEDSDYYYMIREDGYICAHCEKFHSFEDVHGGYN